MRNKKKRGKIWFAKKFHNYVHAGTSSLDADFSSWFANNSFHYKSILWYMLVLLIYILQCLVQASACNSCYLYMYIYIYTIYTGNSLFIYMLVFCNFLSNGFFLLHYDTWTIILLLRLFCYLLLNILSYAWYFVFMCWYFLI